MMVCYLYPLGDNDHMLYYYYNAVTFMAGVIFSYTWLVPVILWATLSWQGLAVATILETIAIYGYSLTIYIPICVSNCSLLICTNNSPTHYRCYGYYQSHGFNGYW